VWTPYGRVDTDSFLEHAASIIKVQKYVEDERMLKIWGGGGRIYTSWPTILLWRRRQHFLYSCIASSSHGVRLSPLGTAATVLLIVPAPDYWWWWLWSNQWSANWQGKPKYSEETCISDILSTKNPTWFDPGSKPGRRVGKPASNRLSYGTAFLQTNNFLRTFVPCTVNPKGIYILQKTRPIFIPEPCMKCISPNLFD
jgi:hypothetical protein